MYIYIYIHTYWRFENWPSRRRVPESAGVEKINKTHNVKKTHYMFTNDVVINKHNTINTNDTYNGRPWRPVISSILDSPYMEDPIWRILYGGSYI